MKLLTLVSGFFLGLPFAFALKNPHRQLVDYATAGNGLIRLDEAAFDLLTSPKRNWSAAIQFTAMGKQRRCAPCKEFFPSFATVAKAWSTSAKTERDGHFFATIDFDEAPSVFQKLGLSSAPVVYVYLPSEGPRRPVSGKTTPLKYDFSNGFEPGPLAEQLSHHTPIPIPYSAPFDWARWNLVAFSVLGFALTLRFISPVLKSRWIWAALIVMTSLVMTSGFMFTRIRGVPYTGPNGQVVAGGYQNQFGQEVQIVAAIYGLLGFSFITLILGIPQQSSPSRQRIQIYLWTAIIMIVYSALLSLFRIKNRGYPFKLLF